MTPSAASRRFACNDLVLDLGMNNGDDSEYYLRKGYRVVAVEANPSLCERARLRFCAAIAAGRLTIHNWAVWTGYEKRDFFVNLANDHWSSLDLQWASRDGTPYTGITIECVPVTHLFNLYGTPTYIKIDIEGADDLVIRQLDDCTSLPSYVSLEDCRFGYEYLETLHRLGYRDFKLLDQSTVHRLVDSQIDYRFQPGSSGPFGESVPGAWLSYAEMIDVYSRNVRDRQNNRLAPRTVWWDIHCRGRASHATDTLSSDVFL
jgi:FkbM family methyltransferase